MKKRFLIIIVLLVCLSGFAQNEKGLKHNNPFENLEAVKQGGYYTEAEKNQNTNQDDYCYGEQTKIFYKNDRKTTVNDYFYKRGDETTYLHWKQNKDGWFETEPSESEKENYDTKKVIKGCNRSVTLYKLKQVVVSSNVANEDKKTQEENDTLIEKKQVENTGEAGLEGGTRTDSSKSLEKKVGSGAAGKGNKGKEPSTINQDSLSNKIKDLEEEIKKLKENTADSTTLDSLEKELKRSKTLKNSEDNGNSNMPLYISLIFLTIVVIFCIFFFLRKKQPKTNTIINPSQGTNKTKPTVVKQETEQPIIVSSPLQTTPPPTPQPDVIQSVTPHTQKSETIPTEADEWIVVGASVIGNGHISMNLPCQDSHKYEYLGEGWGIAVTSDGAGSAKHSDIGSKVVVEACVRHFKDLIFKRNWIKNNELPSEIEWSEISKELLREVRDNMAKVAQNNKVELKSLSATTIVVVHTPDGILATHIGDGRAGYKNQNGEWKALITPHKGDEANQTIFVPSDFWDIPAYKMSGVLVPESVVIKEKPFAFTLMSDGCENTSWLCNQKDEETGKFFDPNKPYPNFFNPLCETLQSFRNDKVEEKERAEKWANFIKEGNKSFEREQDDKTMILGVIYM